MNINQILELVKQSNHQKIKFAIVDIDGVLRGKIIHKEKFLEVASSEIGFCDVILGWDTGDVCYDNSAYTGWHSGYPDAPARIDLSTYRTIPWDNNMPFFLADFRTTDGEDVGACSRSLLKKIYNECVDLGLVPVFALEFEWCNFEGKPQAIAASGMHNLNPITPGMFGYSILRTSLNSDFYNALFDQMEQFDIKLEALHTETGPGVYEAAIRYDDLLLAADKAVLFKTAVKEIAYRFGITASFMAKWNIDLPGCGGHIHQSLWDLERKHNLFHAPGDKNKMSEIMKSYLAGQIACLPYLMPLYAPVINSYKRLSSGAWAPSNASWGIDNRTVALRVLNREEKGTRIEMRVPGADANPYLSMAASLASGLYGIKNKLTLEDAPVTGNGYTQKGAEELPMNLPDAIRKMSESSLARELLGAKFVDHFVATRRWECRQYANQVSDWELRRYLEII